MAGTFQIDAANQPGMGRLVLHDRRGREFAVTTTPTAVADPYQRAALREITRNGKFVAKET